MCITYLPFASSRIHISEIVSVIKLSLKNELLMVVEYDYYCAKWLKRKTIHKKSAACKCTCTVNLLSSCFCFLPDNVSQLQIAKEVIIADLPREIMQADLYKLCGFVNPLHIDIHKMKEDDMWVKGCLTSLESVCVCERERNIACLYACF